VEILGKDGRIRRFGHLDGWNVAIGDEVRAGQTIGKVGNTGASRGAHLHFELRENYLRHREDGKDVPIPYKKVSGMREDTLRRLTSRSGAKPPKGLSVGERAGFGGTLNPEAEAKVMQDAMRRKERTRILLGAALDGFLKQGTKAAKDEKKAARKTAKPAGAAAKTARTPPKKPASGKKPAAPKTPAKKQASAKPAGTKPAAKSKTAATKKAPKQPRRSREAL
jgi:murein DD-endopeptidase MepM/ murein hydrolase activator NlpD